MKVEGRLSGRFRMFICDGVPLLNILSRKKEMHLKSSVEILAKTYTVMKCNECNEFVMKCNEFVMSL